MTSIGGFLLARIAEDEEIAQAIAVWLGLDGGAA